MSALEHESAALSSWSRKSELGHLLPQLLHGLQALSGCSLAADSVNTVQLLLPPIKQRLSTPAAQDQLVPLLLAVPEPRMVIAWDLTLHTLLRYVDGARDTAALATVTNADLSLVRQSLEALQVGGWVRMVDGCVSRYCPPPLGPPAETAPCMQVQRDKRLCVHTKAQHLRK